MTYNAGPSCRTINYDDDEDDDNEGDDNAYIRRERYTEDQLRILNEAFSRDPRPSREEKEQLADELCTNYRRIQIWFQNKRASTKKNGPNMESDIGNNGVTDGVSKLLDLQQKDRLI
ncbi:Homeodomain-like protein [Dichotomocladium elegans]|nr:Homeodomain-like protein [Dichotomocladium elegans]